MLIMPTQLNQDLFHKEGAEARAKSAEPFCPHLYLSLDSSPDIYITFIHDLTISLRFIKVDLLFRILPMYKLAHPPRDLSIPGLTLFSLTLQDNNGVP